MSRTPVLIVCPGRGSYDRASLGQLQDRGAAASAVLDEVDALRASLGRPTVRELDAKERHSGRFHVAGEHASLLTFACSLADLADLDTERFEVVGVMGNSMGWYTALVAAGALSLADGARLVETMGGYQQGNVIGGQVLYPTTDTDWRECPERLDTIAHTLATVPEGAWAGWSIDLGGFAVLAGDGPGVKHLLQALPAEQRGERTFPVQLPLHSAFHTPLMQETSQRARTELADLDFRAPRVPLVDGRGRVFRPLWADPAELFDYTLGHQVVAPYDFTTSLRTALQHCGPAQVVLLGPGNSLGGPAARTLVAEGWAGCADKQAWDARARSEAPGLLASFGVSRQRATLVKPVA